MSKALLFVSCFLSFSFSSLATWDIYKSGVGINGGYYDCLLNTVASDFQHNYFGAYTGAGTLTLDYAEVLTFKNGGSNVCSANLYYRVYRTSDAAPSFTTLTLPFYCEFFNNPVTCSPDINNAGDQKWRGTSGINLITGLTLPGTYIIEVYYDATGDDSGGCTQTKFSSNSSNNYRAYFDFNMTDSFTDGNFTSSAVWSGDTGNIQVVNNSTTSGLAGTEQTRTHTLKLNVASGSGVQYLSTPITSWDAQQDWYFWIGRDNAAAATLANQIQVWLYATESNLESLTNDGYRIVYGDNSGGDNIILQSVTDGVATADVIISSTTTVNALIDYGIALYITRSQTGLWTLRTSYLPQDNTETQLTPTPLGSPATDATVVQGTATNTDYTPGGTGYFGPVFIHSSGSGERSSPEFDSFRFVARPPDTFVQINGATSGTVAEDAALAGNLAIGVDIFNPSSTVATTIDIVLASGDATRAGGGPLSNTTYLPSYTTQTLTWAAGTSGTKYIYIDPADNTACDDVATLVFELQNITGGNNGYIGTPDTYTASITDDNMGYETLLTEDFESGSIPAAWATTGTAWSASSTAPITGTYSARHSTQASAGTSSIAYPFDDVTLPGVATTWRFHLKYQNDPSTNNNFQVFLASSEADFYSGTVDGYAVVVDQSSLPSAGTDDYVRLYRVDNGVYNSTPIVNSTVDWTTNVNSGTKVGIEVILDEDGTWDLRIDANGDFDSVVSLGTGTDLAGGNLTYPVMNHFGVRYRYTAGVSDFIRFDDVSISQKGCKETWYSQSSGNVDAVIWGPLPSSTAQLVGGGRYRRFVVQNTHNVTTNVDWIVNDITIDVGATLTGGSATTKVYGSWINSGVFAEGTSTVQFKGQAAQLILGSISTTFNNLVIDNDGFNVTLLTATNVKGIVSPIEGTLQTGGILTLLSDALGSGSIGEIRTGAAVSGDVTIRRYIPSIPWIYGNWLNLGSPIQGQTIADWNDDVVTTGFTGADYPPPYPFINIRSYTESTAGAMSEGYVNASNVTNALSSSNGYFVWLNGPAQNLDNTGAIQTGTFDSPLSYTVTAGGILNDGWNLMTNQYPSEVDWNELTSTFTASNPRVYYVFDHQTNAYKNYNAANGLGSASRYLPHSQSFLVKVNTPGQNLHYEESYKTAMGTSFERSLAGTQQFIAMKLERNGMSDESILSFNDAALAAYDGFDAFDLESPNAESVEFSLMSSDNVNLAQDSRALTSDLEIPVYLDMPEAGTYSFSVEEVQNLPLGSCLYVEDLVTGNTMNLQPGEQMSLVTSAPFQGIRLMIHATAPVTVLATDATCAGSANGSIDVTTPSGGWSVTLQDENGTNEYISSGSATFDHLPAGTYILSVANGEACAGAQQTITIGQPAEVSVVLADITPSACDAGSNGAIEFNVENADWFSFEVMDHKNQVVASAEVEGSVGVVTDLPSGVYTLNVYTTCTSNSFEADVRDPHAPEFTLLDIPASTVLSNGIAEAHCSAVVTDGTVLWSCSNGQTGSGNMFTVRATEAGEYIITVLNTSGDCTKEYTRILNVRSDELSSGTSRNVQLIQFSEYLQLTWSAAMPETVATVEVFDGAGRIVYSKGCTIQPSQQVIIPTTGLAGGVYTLHIQSAEELLLTRKIVK